MHEDLHLTSQLTIGWGTESAGETLGLRKREETVLFHDRFKLYFYLNLKYKVEY